MAAKTKPPVQEENPTRGGSYNRNPDGTLTQTEGPKPQPDVPAIPTQSTQEQ